MDTSQLLQVVMIVWLPARKKGVPIIENRCQDGRIECTTFIFSSQEMTDSTGRFDKQTLHNIDDTLPDAVAGPTAFS